MLDLLFLIFTYFTEALIVFLYAKKIYEAKWNYSISFISLVVAYSLLLIIYHFIYNNDTFNLILTMIANVIILYFSFNSSFKSALFHGVTLVITQLISEFITIYLSAMALGISSRSFVNNHFETGVIISRIFYFSLTSLLAKMSIKETQSNNWGKWLTLSLLPISSMFSLLVLKAITDTMELTITQYAMSIISAAFLLIVNIIIYTVYEESEKNTQRLLELELENQRSKIDMQYIKLLENKNETMKIMAHDYKNHIATLTSLTDSDEVQEYIQSMLGEISQYEQTGKTKNKTLDVILSKYADICKSKDITFNTEIISDNLELLKSKDISTLFNNILDNAVEAAEKTKEKNITLEISAVLGSFHKITLKNSCETEPKTESRKLLTLKNDKEVHGIGMKSVNKTLKKYNGEMQWDYNEANKTFKTVILIPAEQCK